MSLAPRLAVRQPFEHRSELGDEELSFNLADLESVRRRLLL
jgi:hypothetical protein